MIQIRIMALSVYLSDYRPNWEGLTAVDDAWALQILADFAEVTSEVGNSQGGVSEDVPLGLAPIVEQILDRVVPTWRSDDLPKQGYLDGPWRRHRVMAVRARTLLFNAGILREKLGDAGPTITAASLHPWVWEGARSLWQSGHFRDAVRTASIKVNAECQNKLKRRDISEKDLFDQAFTPKEAQAGSPRLRLSEDDGSPTFTSLHRGVRAFAEGCYAALRNPASHVLFDSELPEHEALEQLAALSVLARWVDAATVVEAEPDPPVTSP